MIRSKIICSLLIFFLFNILSFAFLHRHKDPDYQMASSEIEIYRSVRKSQQLDAVFLGSSLMVHVVRSIERKESNCNTKGANPDLIEFPCVQQHSQSLKLFSLAYPLQMVSDSYILLKTVVLEGVPPRAVTLGLSPREFYDYDEAKINQTMTFRHFVGFSNIRYFQDYLPSFSSKLEFLADNLCYLYSKRASAQAHLKAFLRNCFPDSTQSGNECAMDASSKRTALWAKSVVEYKWRFRDFSLARSRPQLEILQKLLSTCSARGIKVFLIQLPISDDARKLLPDGEYKALDRALENMARGHACYLDLGQSPEFNKNNFEDVVHLAPSGGQKVFLHILSLLQQKGAH